MHKKVIRIEIANTAHLCDLEKPTGLRITSQTPRWDRLGRPGSHTLDMEDVSKAEVMAAFSDKKLEVSFQTC
jgi:hypothetical protein